MFKLEDKVPQYYLNESRDFQFLIRLLDSTNMSVREDIACVVNLNDARSVKNNLLDLLAKKVGFFTRKHIDDNVLRNIVSAFRTAVNNKGTETGIKQAAIAILKAENTVEKPFITTTMENEEEPHNSYKIIVYTPINIINTVALREFLNYVVPAGFSYTIKPYEAMEEGEVTNFTTVQQSHVITSWDPMLSLVRQGNKDFSPGGIYTNVDINGNALNSTLSNMYITSYEYSDLLNRTLSTADLGMVANLDTYMEVKGKTKDKNLREGGLQTIVNRNDMNIDE